jgi:predicted nucleotidyltransferase
MIALLTDNRDKIAQLCSQLAVNRLDVFGSAVTDQFDPSRSDVDFVVEFNRHDEPGILDRYLALAERLEALLRRPVDLVTTASIRNPYFRETIEATKESIYVDDSIIWDAVQRHVPLLIAWLQQHQD